MKRLYLFLLFIGIMLLCCEKDTGPLNNTRVTLTAEYVGVTEADIKLRIDPPENGLSFQFFRNDSLTQSGNLTAEDTILYDEALTPAKTYNYSAKIFDGQEIIANSQQLPINTMDTTSHKISWELFQLGNPMNSTILDVSIISENNVWVVGKISTDSGQYNAANWDGNAWKLKKIPFIGPCSAVDYPVLHAITSYNSLEIAVTNGGALAFHNGIATKLDCQVNPLLDGMLTTISSADSQSIVSAGNMGTIVSYSDNAWSKVESGTTQPINDIYFIKNPDKKLQQYIATVGDIYGGFYWEILTIKPDLSVKRFPWVNRAVHSVWAKEYNRIYACGDGIWIYKQNKWHEINNVPGAFRRRIRGNSENNIFVSGDYGFISHFNGINWKTWQWPDMSIFYSIDVNKNIVVAPGAKGGIVLGKNS